MNGTRITMTIPADLYEVLEMLATTTYKRPGDFAKDIVLGVLLEVNSAISLAQGSDNKDAFLLSLYKNTMLKITDSFSDDL